MKFSLGLPHGTEPLECSSGDNEDQCFSKVILESGDQSPKYIIYVILFSNKLKMVYTYNYIKFIRQIKIKQCKSETK